MAQPPRALARMVRIINDEDATAFYVASPRGQKASDLLATVVEKHPECAGYVLVCGGEVVEADAAVPSGYL